MRSGVTLLLIVGAVTGIEASNPVKDSNVRRPVLDEACANNVSEEPR